MTDLDTRYNLRRRVVLLLISIGSDFLIVFCTPTLIFAACLDPPLNDTFAFNFNQENVFYKFV